MQENAAYIFKQIEILVLDKIQIFNITRIALRGWLKTACYVFPKRTTLSSCPEGLCKVLFRRQIDCRTYQTEWQLLIVFDIFLRSPAVWRAELIRTFSTYFRKYEKCFSFYQTALPFCDLIAGSHTFCHSALNSVNLWLAHRLLYKLYHILTNFTVLVVNCLTCFIKGLVYFLHSEIWRFFIETVV